MPAMRGEGARIKGFIEASFVDWPGRVASVVFLPGCNLRCPFCHNHPLVLNPGAVKDIPLDHVLARLKDHEGWVDGVVVTGGEPTVSPGLDGLLGRFKRLGLTVKLDTNGTRPEVIQRLIKEKLVDAVAMDVKAVPLAPYLYEKAAGSKVDLGAITDSILLLVGSPIEVTFRTTVVPGLHDSGAVKAIAEALHGRPLVLQNFRPDDALEPSYRHIRPFTPEEFDELQRAANRGTEKASPP